MLLCKQRFGSVQHPSEARVPQRIPTEPGRRLTLAHPVPAPALPQVHHVLFRHLEHVRVVLTQRIHRQWHFHHLRGLVVSYNYSTPLIP